jgi:hypothetical protein
MNLVSVVLHDKTTDTYSDNLLGDNVTLNSGYTLMGVVLDLTKASTEYEFVVTNDNNTDFSLPCDDLGSLKINETSITLRYDSETKTGRYHYLEVIPAIQLQKIQKPKMRLHLKLQVPLLRVKCDSFCKKCQYLKKILRYYAQLCP